MSKIEAFDELVEAMAKEAVRSSLLQSSVAERVKKDKRLIDGILDKVDSRVFSEVLAKELIHLKNTGHMSPTQNFEYTSLMKKATDRAVEIVAKKLAKDTIGA